LKDQPLSVSKIRVAVIWPRKTRFLRARRLLRRAIEVEFRTVLEREGSDGGVVIAGGIAVERERPDRGVVNCRRR
jgi:hypothetical protein